jgi:hypothetical protein
MKGLRRFISSGQKNYGKSKGRAVSAASSDLYSSIVANGVKLSCSDFSAALMVWFVVVAGFSTDSGA